MKTILLAVISLLLIGSGAAADRGDPMEGKKLFLTFCSACHGSGGEGDGEASRFLETRPRDLTDQQIMLKKTDEELFNFINQGKKEFHGARFIPQFRLEFEESQVWDIVAYIRSLSRQSRGNAIRGRKHFMAHCASCHGSDGKGKGEEGRLLEIEPRDLTDDSVMSRKTDRELYVAIVEGGSIIHGSTVMPRWADELTPEQTWDLVAYLRLLHRKPVYSGSPEQGKKKFEKNCAFCHGDNARGQTEVSKAFSVHPPDLTRPDYLSSLTDLDIYIAILGGGDAVGHSEFMPSWGEVLSEEDIWDLVAFIRSLERANLAGPDKKGRGER